MTEPTYTTLRNNAIIRSAQSGLTIPEMCLKHNLATSTIRRVLKVNNVEFAVVGIRRKRMVKKSPEPAIVKYSHAWTEAKWLAGYKMEIKNYGN